jgi:hypothetical protein
MKHCSLWFRCLSKGRAQRTLPLTLVFSLLVPSMRIKKAASLFLVPKKMLVLKVLAVLIDNG